MRGSGQCEEVDGGGAEMCEFFELFKEIIGERAMALLSIGIEYFKLV